MYTRENKILVYECRKHSKKVTELLENFNSRDEKIELKYNFLVLKHKYIFKIDKKEYWISLIIGRNHAKYDDEGKDISYSNINIRFSSLLYGNSQQNEIKKLQDVIWYLIKENPIHNTGICKEYELKFPIRVTGQKKDNHYRYSTECNSGTEQNRFFSEYFIVGFEATLVQQFA